MTRLVCSTCGCESWSWSAYEVDPIALDFRQAHQQLGHTVKVKVERRKTTDATPVKVTTTRRTA